MLTNASKLMVIDSNVNEHQNYENYLENQNHYQLEAIHQNVSAALQDFKEPYPDIIVSEVHLKGISGINAIELFKRKKKDVKIILLSKKSEFDLIRRAFKCGASGYLTKPLNRDRFINALDSVQSDGAAMCHDVAKKVVSMFQEKNYPWFSKRENQIAVCLTRGATYKDIAEQLFITPSTVNFHIQNIYLKLNVNSKSAALEKLRQWDDNFLQSA